MLRWMMFLVLSSFPLLSAAESFIPPAGAQLLDEKQQIEGHFRIAKGRIRGVNNRWQFEDEDNINGMASFRTWQLDDSVNYLDNVAYIKQRLEQADGEVIYQCQGRSCGASNIWANSYFNDWRLYGPDDRQYLWVSLQEQQYRLLYLIERGNRKVYLHEKTIHFAANETSHPTHIFSQCDTKAIQQLAQQYKGIVVVSSPNDADQQQSLKLAKQCQQELSPLGITVVGLGGFDRHWKAVSVLRYEWVSLP